MNYERFVRQRKPLWDEFEARLKLLLEDERRLAHGELETLAFRYRQVLHDHAHARARFPGTGAARRLKDLALAGTRALQWERPTQRPSLRGFFSRTFPLAFRRHLPYVGVTSALFFTAFLVGATFSWLQLGVGTALLGERAVEGLRQGRLWTESLTTTVPPGVSSSAIATNNMSVALTGWAGGALFGLGSLYVVLFNGFMLGAVLAATSHYGLTGELLEFVAAHGPLEITLILVTAGGGLALGRALVAADDRPRRESAAEAARHALVLLVGCLPWFVVLGLVEGFLSPAPALPPILKAALGVALLGLFLVLAWNPFLPQEASA
jgi:uncharacterized membrane protein SpoIIM required for sporulation